MDFREKMKADAKLIGGSAIVFAMTLCCCVAVAVIAGLSARAFIWAIGW